MRSIGFSGLPLAAVLIIAGIVMISPIVAWLLKVMGFVLIVLGITVALMALLGGRSTTRS